MQSLGVGIATVRWIGLSFPTGRNARVLITRLVLCLAVAAMASAIVASPVALGAGDGGMTHAGSPAGPAGSMPLPESLFITTWETGAAGESITIPVGDAEGTYAVDWGDGSTGTHSGDATHEYDSPGIYTVQVWGDFARIYLGGDPENAAKLRSIDQWGTAEWTTMESAFRDAANMTYNATDAPDLAEVTDMSSMFHGASSFNGGTSSWDVSGVTDMSWMFTGADSFNQPLDSWDVSGVTDMEGMFKDAASFDQPLDSWDVSGVTDMEGMFKDAASFDQPLDSWDVSGVTDMNHMFAQNASFDQPLDSWDVSGVTDMSWMFEGANSFDQPLDSWDVSGVTDMNHMFAQNASFDQPLDSWNVSSVTDMSGMFAFASSFDQPLDSWDVSAATDMSGMFAFASSFDQPLDSWDVSGVTDMNHMFAQNASFDQPLDSWDVSSVTDMSSMFRDAGSFDQPLDSWDVSAATYMSFMFSGADSFNQDLGDWDVSSVTYMSSMFRDAGSFDQPLDSWDVSSVTDMSSMFRDAGSFDQPLDSWDVSAATYMYGMFSGADSFNQDLGDWDVSSVTDMSSMFWDAGSFDQPLDSWDVSAATYMYGMFSGADSFNQDLGDWYIVPVSTMVFHDAVMVTAITAQNGYLEGQNPTYTVVPEGDGDMFEMYGNVLQYKLPTYTKPSYDITIVSTGGFSSPNSISLTITVVPPIQPPATSDRFVTTWQTDYPGETITIPVGDATGTYAVDWGDGHVSMHRSDTTHIYTSPGTWTVQVYGDFTRIYLGGDPENAAKLRSIDQWGTAEWTTMESAFRDAANMTYNATDAPDLAEVTDMSRMFHGASSFNGGISSWDVSGVTDMSGMFRDAESFNQPLDAWDVSAATDMSGMLAGANSFDQPLDSWDVSAATDMSGMFMGAFSFDQPLDSWDVSAATDMYGVFAFASSFNQPLDSWDVSAATDMSDMFRDAESFNQPLGSWDVSSVAYMSSMFRDAGSFNQPLDSWDVSAATDMSGMFSGADSFNQDLGDWYVVPGDTEVAVGDLAVTTLAAQNRFLDGQNPSYSVVPEGDGDLFEVRGNVLLSKSAEYAKASYDITVVSSGGFGHPSSMGITVTVADGPTAAPVIVAGTVFYDTNGNGTRDAGEAGIPGYTMHVIDPASPHAVLEAVTDAGGTYIFGINAMDETVLVQTSYFPFDHVITTGPFYAYVSPGPGKTATFDAGFRPVLPSEAVTLNVTTFRDLDYDGTRDAGEPALPGVTVRIHTYSTGETWDVVTDAGGTASTDIVPADFRAQAVLLYWHATSPGDPASRVPGMLTVADPAPGSTVPMEIGLVPP